MITFLSLLSFLACTGASPEVAEAAVEGVHADVITLSEPALANAHLLVEALAPTPLAGTGIAPARIALDPRREAHVSAVTGGQLERILVRPGDPVTAGQSLATVLSPDLGEAIGAHLSAGARLEVATAKRDRVSQLVDAEAEHTVAAAEHEAAEERLRVFGVEPASVVPAKGQHFSSRFSVKSPVEGAVLIIDASVGKSVEPGDALFHVGNLDEVWLLADVYERDLAAVKPGSAMSFTVDAYGAELFTGTIDQVGDWLDPDSRKAEIRVVVPNADHRLRRGRTRKVRGPPGQGRAARRWSRPGPRRARGRRPRGGRRGLHPQERARRWAWTSRTGSSR
jgi:cobalt-zinc-cadmium efflux system membrane fusion protein